MSIVSVDNIQPIGSGTSVTVNNAATLVVGNLNSSGVVTATSFTGDGSGLTGVTATGDNIIEGNTKAEVVDTGSNGHFKVETEGTERLRITSDGRIGINDSAPNDYELDIMKRSTATDANLRLYNNATGSSNDTILRLHIAGTSASNYIYFGDGDDTNAGQLRYQHSNNSLQFYVNAAERLRIDSTGNVTKPDSFHILVNRNGNQTGYTATGTTGPIIWNRIITSQSSANAANHFNTSTGIFTAPVTGYYYFQATVHANFTVQESWLIINGSRPNYSNVQPTRTGTSPASIVITYKLTAGDEVGLKWYENGGTNRTINANDLITWWRIVLLG